MTVSEPIINRIAVHHIGDKSLGEDLVLGRALLNPDTEELAMLHRFFLDHFKSQEFFNFKGAPDVTPGSRLRTLVNRVFDDPENLHAHSCEIARMLFAFTESEFISSGVLLICDISDVLCNDELTDAVGIYFCPVGDTFFTARDLHQKPVLQFLQGTYLGRQEMACLIYNTDGENGFKIDVIDKSKKSRDGQFWKDHFLQLSPAEDDFYFTSQVMGMTKAFVENQMPIEFETEKKDQWNYLDRSLDYFKTQDHYSEKDFADHVFKDFDVVEAFGDYQEKYQNTHNLALSPDFDVDQYAVKKQARHFKSVLKLDRNFHVYIHGDRSKIEKGQDEQGRKFYRLFYDHEF